MLRLKKLDPRKAAIVGFLMTLPIGILFTSIVFDIEIIEEAFKAALSVDGDRPSVFGFAYMLISLIALPVGLLVSLWPIIQGRRFYFLNVIVVLIALGFVVPIFGEFLEEIYRCEVLEIPNCD